MGVLFVVRHVNLGMAFEAFWRLERLEAGTAFEILLVGVSLNVP